MKRRILGIALAVAMLASLLVGSSVLAADPTGVNVTWGGAGLVDGTVTAGDDAVTYFHSEGTSHIGEFNAIDDNHNPYGYGVDSCSFSMETTITTGEQAWLEVNRTDSGPYGPAGQQSFTYVWTDNGNATLQNRSSTNYASMRDCNYSWHSNDHITVTGADTYTLIRYMDSENTVAGDANFAGLRADGTGDADLDCMNAEASAGQVRLGVGCGCYTNAKFNATGTGVFQLDGAGNNSATTAMAPGMTGASSFTIIANWASSFSIADYSVTAN